MDHRLSKNLKRVANSPPDIDAAQDSCSLLSYHPNGGGLVSLDADVDAGVYVGPEAVIAGRCVVHGAVRLEGRARISGHALVVGTVLLRHDASIAESARVVGRVTLTNRAKIAGDADVEGEFFLEYFAFLSYGVRLRGRARIGG